MKKGWIKQYRRDICDLVDLTDQEFRYFYTSLLLAVWDKKKTNFGTFDARTRILKAEALPNWSDGKINTTKNSLIKKGYLKVAADFRLEIINAKYVFGKTKEVEYYIQNAEHNFHIDENEIQRVEKTNSDVRQDANKLYRSVAIPWNKGSEY